MTLNEIAKKLNDNGCDATVWKDSRVYVNATPNGGKGRYGFCVAADNVNTIVSQIVKRQGEIAAILRK